MLGPKSATHLQAGGLAHRRKLNKLQEYSLISLHNLGHPLFSKTMSSELGLSTILLLNPRFIHNLSHNVVYNIHNSETF